VNGPARPDLGTQDMTRTRLTAALAATFCAAFGATAPVAGASVRWSAPDAATGAPCTPDAPCRLDTAVNGAVAGDEVILKPGNYDVTYPVAATAAIDVHGQAGKAVPHLVGGPGGNPTLEMKQGGSLSRVFASSQTSGGYAVSIQGVIADGIEVATTGGSYGIELHSAAAATVLRNSVVWVDGGGSALQVKEGVLGSTIVMGVTAVGTNGGDGIVVKSSSSTTTIKNTIAHGSSWDIEKKPVAVAPTVSYSNYRPANATGVTDAGGNQIGAPVYLDAAAGDLRPVAGSPTLDAGGMDALSGPYDARGAARAIGTGTDIGAYEFDPADPPVKADPPVDNTGPGNTSTTPQPGNGDGDGAHPTPGPGDNGQGNGPGNGKGPDKLPPQAQPVLGATVTLGESKGALFVRLPGTDRFIELKADSTVPVGAVIDATKGTIDLTSVRDATGKTQTGQFSGGVFQVRQSRHDSVTELVLTGGDFGACKSKPARHGKLVAAGGRHKATIRRLWGRDRGGRFRTRGRHGSATVRGTRWLTEDRCDGTLFKVAEGAIDVRDDRTHKTVRVRRGRSYTALTAAAAKKKRR
jgi:hypothetical protein